MMRRTEGRSKNEHGGRRVRSLASPPFFRPLQRGQRLVDCLGGAPSPPHKALAPPRSWARQGSGRRWPRASAFSRSPLQRFLPPLGFCLVIMSEAPTAHALKLLDRLFSEQEDRIQCRQTGLKAWPCPPAPRSKQAYNNTHLWPALQ